MDTTKLEQYTMGLHDKKGNDAMGAIERDVVLALVLGLRVRIFVTNKMASK